MQLMIVGEAFSRFDEEAGRPFSGAAGHLLTQVLAMAGISKDECYYTNVFMQRPAGNDTGAFCGGKGTAIPGFPALYPAKYVRKEFQYELDRLEAEIKLHKPNLILALGGGATWFLLKDRRISKIRGSAVSSRFGVKVIGSYHPSAVLRDYSLRPILISDAVKAAREKLFPEVRRPQRYIHIEPTLADLEEFYQAYIASASALSIDVETIGNQVTCLGIAPSADRALVIPFYDPTKPGANYWPTRDQEIEVWKFVARVIALGLPNIGQNFTYDAKFFWRSYGIPVIGMEGGDDTMLLHHALQPELQKGLAFLGTIYTDEAPWKLERKVSTIKREE